MEFPIWLRQLLFRSERALRYANPAIVAHYWDGGAPKGHRVRDISATGAYLYTNERWYVGTIIELTLQRDGGEAEGDSGLPFVSVTCRVVRHTPDGVGIKFMLPRSKERKALKRFMRSAALDKWLLRHDGASVGDEQGQALVELAVAVPMIFLLIALTFNFGTWLYGWTAVGNAARAAGDYSILSGTSAGLPPTATSRGLQSLIATDLTYLPNVSSSNPKACVQNNNNGTIKKLLESPSGACATANAAYGAPPADTEAKAPTTTLTYPNVTV